MNLLKRFISAILVGTMIFSVTACSNKDDNKDDVVSSNPSANETEETTKKAEPVTIKFFSNVPDRNAGYGKVEQMLIDSYIEENPNVTVKVEALQDEPYKTKFKAYTTSNDLPDIVTVWGQPAFIDPVINSGYLAELNQDDYKDYDFIPGCLNGFSANEKLYGLPRGTDMMVFYYNKKLFTENNFEIPQTMADLIELGEKCDEIGIAGCSIDAKDKWPISIMFSDIVLKITGDNTTISTAIKNKDFSSNPQLLAAAQQLSELGSSKLFQKGFTSTDYGTSKNLFAQSKAATFYMGSWEMGMVTDESLPEEFRKNIGVFTLPLPESSQGKSTDISAWNGGGYAVSENSKVKDEAIKLLNYMYKKENLAQQCWDQSVCFPVQSYELTGNETNVQSDLTTMLTGATSIAGTPINDMATPEFKTDCEDLSQQLLAGMITPEDFLSKLDESLS